MSAFAAAPAFTFKATVRGTKLSASKPVVARAATKRAAVVAEWTEGDALRKYPVGGSIYKAEINCSRGHISMGLMFKQGPDGRPEVSMIRPGGTAKGKLEIGDVCLAASYTALRQDQSRAWGVAETGWFDTEGINYDVGIANMTTNSSSLQVIMDRAYVPKGGAASSQPANSVSSYSSYSQPPTASSESSYSSSSGYSSSSQSSYSSSQTSSYSGSVATAKSPAAGGVISSTTPAPPTGRETVKTQKELDAEKEDIAAWAAKIAAEARQKQGGY